jgi:hypothetical protein
MNIKIFDSNEVLFVFARSAAHMYTASKFRATPCALRPGIRIVQPCHGTRLAKTNTAILLLACLRFWRQHVLMVGGARTRLA